jgi:transcription elongation factor Elf1
MEGQTEIKENLTCPVCGRAGLVSTVKRSQLPAMQNYVYRRIDLARNAKQGRLDLAVCPGCGPPQRLTLSIVGQDCAEYMAAE